LLSVDRVVAVRLLMVECCVQAQLYLMYGAMDGNRLCAMAVGNKHTFGLDSVPRDYEQGYGL